MSKKTKQLLVEGNDDFHTIMALCQKFNIKENFDIVDCKGIDTLFAELPVRLRQPEIDTLAIIVDADTEINNRWDTIKSIFFKSGIVIHDEINAGGLIVKSEDITIGVWIMPNNKLNGMLEDFISFLIPNEDELLPIAQQTLELIENSNLNKYISSHKSKALIHCWLAWQENPGTPMGQAITKKFLTTDEETCQKLIVWLQTVFQ